MRAFALEILFKQNFVALGAAHRRTSWTRPAPAPDWTKILDDLGMSCRAAEYQSETNSPQWPLVSINAKMSTKNYKIEATGAP